MRLPNHIGIIPDGNRRWASNHGLNKDQGYQYGLQPGLQLLKQLKEIGIKEITYYGFTVDNCKRPKAQYQAFSQACVDAVNIMSEVGIDLLVLGNTNSKSFPQELLPYTKRCKINGGGPKVNLLVNYGWQWDLNNIEKCGKPHSSEISRMDLIIRWGGMRRLSGFLPIQSVYADFYVEDKLWPDFDKQDIFDALAWYDKQDVTLGG
jgi:undecaprenyl diphosphate synthase